MNSLSVTQMLSMMEFLDCLLDSRKYFVRNNRTLTVTWVVFNTIQNECLNEKVSITLTSADCQECSQESGPIPVNYFSYTFGKPLELCTSYNYSVHALWNSREKRVSIDPVYPKIKNIELIEGTDHKSMNISWSYPEASNCPKAFKVEARGESGSYFRVESETLFKSFSDELTACEFYEFSVSPMVAGEVLPEYGITAEYTLNESVISPVTDLTAEYNETTEAIDLNWRHSQQYPMCIKSYTVHVENPYDNQTLQTLSNNARFNFIVSCSRYRFRVDITTVNGIEIEGPETIIKDIPRRGM